MSEVPLYRQGVAAQLLKGFYRPEDVPGGCSRVPPLPRGTPNVEKAGNLISQLVDGQLHKAPNRVCPTLDRVCPTPHAVANFNIPGTHAYYRESDRRVLPPRGCARRLLARPVPPTR